MLTRDYPDLLWAAYNYWCSKAYDKECDKGFYVKPGIHVRSPEIFHDIVQGSINGTYVPTPMGNRLPCADATDYFQGWVEDLWAHAPLENTLILSSEELSEYPRLVWKKIADSMGWILPHPNLGKFESVRYNTQSNKGAGKVVDASSFVPGVYEASQNRPVLNKTRDILTKCWTHDCVWTTSITNFSYQSCAGNHLSHHNDINDILSSQGKLFDFNTSSLQYLVYRSLLASKALRGFMNRTIDPGVVWE